MEAGLELSLPADIFSDLLFRPLHGIFSFIAINQSVNQMLSFSKFLSLYFSDNSLILCYSSCFWSIGPRPSDQSDAIVAGCLYI